MVHVLSPLILGGHLQQKDVAKGDTHDCFHLVFGRNGLIGMNMRVIWAGHVVWYEAIHWMGEAISFVVYVMSTQQFKVDWSFALAYCWLEASKRHPWLNLFLAR